ncbi:MAG: magnesium transporter [Gammaproteobacteria bacterium]|nr:magnesium transporter [Gammaproteobacteria bacterium]MDH5240107.1 magnesium transporter [Gammaproteobacteria bacterium]MDH5260071.1 magnesium transporter [Gammaproteobacteria bacterium]
MDAREQKRVNLEKLRQLLEGGRMRAARVMVNSLHPSELARLLESLPRKKRAVLWELVDPEIGGDVLVEVSDAVREDLIDGMQPAALIAAAEGMQVDDLADLLIDLPEAVTQEVLLSLNKQDHDRVRQVLAYDEESAGGLMNVDIVTVRPDVTLEVVARYLRFVGNITDGTDSIFVVSRDNTYIGSLYLSRLLTGDSEEMVANVMSTDITPITADTPSAEVVWEFENHDLLSAPVVDENFRVLGRITIDDVVDVIREEAEHSLMGAAGLDEEDDMFAPVVKSAGRRALWLGINLATAFLAAAVVDVFQTTVDKIVLLAVLMPVVPSMGGVAGSQSLTIMTRAIALGLINKDNIVGILRKELLVGALNGIAWAIVVSLFTFLWFEEWRIGAIIGAAMIINLFVAALAGFSIPLILKRLHVDPALAGGVVLTTVTDVIGYAAFLGLGAAFLL